MSEVNGKQLLAEGAVIDLGDGVERRLIFDMQALLTVEQRCGSLGEYVDAVKAGFKGRVLNAVLAGLVGTLSHDRTIGEARIQALLMRRMGQGFRGLQAYLDALDAAWSEAFPFQEDEAPVPGKDSARAASSPGPSSTAEQPSTTVAVTASSGE